MKPFWPRWWYRQGIYPHLTVNSTTFTHFVDHYLIYNYPAQSFVLCRTARSFVRGCVFSKLIWQPCFHSRGGSITKLDIDIVRKVGILLKCQYLSHRRWFFFFIYKGDKISKAQLCTWAYRSYFPDQRDTFRSIFQWKWNIKMTILYLILSQNVPKITNPCIYLHVQLLRVHLVALI